MNELQIFKNQEFGQVRTILLEGKLYAVGSDIAKALGYSIPHKAVRDNCRGVLSENILTKGGEQSMLVIPEPDIYRLIFKAADQSVNTEIQERAEVFQKWIFEDVIPSIRQTGCYGNPQVPGLDFKQTWRLAKLLKETPKYKLPMIVSIFKTQGYEIDVNNSIKEIQEADEELRLVEAFVEAISTNFPMSGQEVYQKFIEYCKGNNFQCLSAKQFVGKMRDIGCKQKITRSNRYMWHISKQANKKAR